jgi:hypothetical protein
METTLKEIPFNPKLIGREEIVIKYRDGSDPYKVLWEDDWDMIVVVNSKGNCINHQINGGYSFNDVNYNDLIMYQKIIIMSTDEWLTERVKTPGPYQLDRIIHEFADAVRSGEVDVNMAL